MIKLSAFIDEYSSNIFEQIEGLKTNGIELVELRSIGGKNVSMFTDEEANEYYKLFEENGIKVWSIGSPLGKIDINNDFNEYKKTVKRVCEIAKIFKTDKIRIFSFFNAFNQKDKVIEYLKKMALIAKEYGITLYHENEKDIYGDTKERVEEIMKEVSEIKFIYDPANFVQCNVNPNESINDLFDNISYFHIKDVIKETQELVPAGYGSSMIDKIIEKLLPHKDYVFTLEPHLALFDAYSEIDNTKLNTKFHFNDSKEAFNAAVKSLKELIIKCGYKEYDNCFIKDGVVRYGIIGAGNIGSQHIEKFLKIYGVEDATVYAISDLNEKKLKSMIDKYPQHKFKTYPNGDLMLEDKNLDVVIVATPHYDHPRFAIKAMEKGINVISEKPAGVYTKQVKEMNEVAKKSDVLFGLMFNQRTNCLYRKMRELIQNKEIGEIKRINWIITDWYRTQYYYDSGDWRATWSGEGGGVLMNQCPHQIDLLWWVVGMIPKSIQAFSHYGKWHNIEVEDDVTAYLEYENGATGVFITTTGDAPGDNRFEVLGSKGKLICEKGKLTLFKNEVDEREFCFESKEGFATPKYSEMAVETDGHNPQHLGILQNFTKAVLKKEELFVSGLEGINGVEITNAMMLSSFLGKKVDLPIDDELFYSELMKRVKTSRRKEVNNDIVLDASNSYNTK